MLKVLNLFKLQEFHTMPIEELKFDNNAWKKIEAASRAS